MDVIPEPVDLGVYWGRNLKSPGGEGDENGKGKTGNRRAAAR
jgi:hypothetical protein